MDKEILPGGRPGTGCVKLYNVREVIKMNKQTKLKTGSSGRPAYVSRRGKLLWIDVNRRYDFCSIKGYQILVDKNGKFWGYDHSKKIKRII